MTRTDNPRIGNTSVAERDLDRTTIPSPAPVDGEQDDWQEAGEEDVPTVVLYVVAGLLLLAFTLYLAVGGGHQHFH
jgi:hypothetical protein